MTLELAGVYRECRRCHDWLAVSEFKGLAKLCKACMNPRYAKLVGRTLVRAMAITESGHALLRQWRAEAS